MMLAADDPRLIRLDSQVRALGLSQEQVLSAMMFAVHAYGGERGQRAVRQLCAMHRNDARWTFDFDRFAAMAGVSPDHLFTLLETGVAEFGPRIRRQGYLQ
jgi:hypothetical protein